MVNNKITGNTPNPFLGKGVVPQENSKEQKPQTVDVTAKEQKAVETKPVAPKDVEKYLENYGKNTLAGMGLEIQGINTKGLNLDAEYERVLNEMNVKFKPGVAISANTSKGLNVIAGHANALYSAPLTKKVTKEAQLAGISPETVAKYDREGLRDDIANNVFGHINNSLA